MSQPETAEERERTILQLQLEHLAKMEERGQRTLAYARRLLLTMFVVLISSFALRYLLRTWQPAYLVCLLLGAMTGYALAALQFILMHRLRKLK